MANVKEILTPVSTGMYRNSKDSSISLYLPSRELPALFPEAHQWKQCSLYIFTYVAEVNEILASEGSLSLLQAHGLIQNKISFFSPFLQPLHLVHIISSFFSLFTEQQDFFVKERSSFLG